MMINYPSKFCLKKKQNMAVPVLASIVVFPVVPVQGFDSDV